MRLRKMVAFGRFLARLATQEPEARVLKTVAPGHGMRFSVRCLLDGRQFENFHLDVGQGDPVLEAPDVLTAPDLLLFAEIPPATVRCYPLTTQVAEKLHTYTRRYASGETSRARDLVDILLAASLEQFNDAKLRQAVEAAFRARATHAVPREMPDPPGRDTEGASGQSDWSMGLR